MTHETSPAADGSSSISKPSDAVGETRPLTPFEREIALDALRIDHMARTLNLMDDILFGGKK
jgi:hypothetical protein